MIDKNDESLRRHLEDFRGASENWPFPPGEEFRGAAQRQRERDDSIISSVVLTSKSTKDG